MNVFYSYGFVLAIIFGVLIFLAKKEERRQK